ncbi:competence/damage-inducible protein A [Polaribacter sp. BM10]|uniref:competence/damage-inducible protein A n=1 Tax=Polaribacter sp. BM10 TaxID=1529069 RepID=UPI00098B175D|nr:competence/damage-inducible protein A [Polaribacter sp. BM10]AQS93507.1 competence/damage-inducible protein A [Polaribacter sp. BM10]
MNAEIITIGDEILIGQIVDTNSQFIGQQLNKIGVSVYQVTSIQDDKQHILNALKEAQERVDIVILTGGLGPTKDDITKKTIATYFKDDEVIEYPEVIAHIKALFKKINHPFKEIQKTQAQLPSKATLLMNTFGTAPGMWFFENETVFVSLPGVPYEMKGLIVNEVLPRIQKQYQLPYIFHKTIMTYGAGESTIAETLEHFEDNLPGYIKLAYLPSFGKVRLRLSAKGTDRELLEKELTSKVDEVYKLIPEFITGLDDDNSLEKRVGELLTKNKKTLATAESLTGGKIAATLVAVPGSSSYYKGSIVAYSEEAKINLLDVSAEIIKEHSVVSKQVALAMAKGVKNKLKTDYAIAVTGNAGPTQDKTDKSVGVVFVAFVSDNEEFVRAFDFGQPREKVINRTVSKALEILQKEIL